MLYSLCEWLTSMVSIHCNTTNVLHKTRLRAGFVFMDYFFIMVIWYTFYACRLTWLATSTHKGHLVELASSLTAPGDKK